MLVEPAGIKTVPGINFRNHSEMNKPVMLQGFVKALWSIRRNPLTNTGHFHQFDFPVFIGFDLGQFFQFVSVSFGKKDDGIGSDFHGFEFFPFIQSRRVVKEVESLK